MHDPQTLALTIPRPWPSSSRFPGGARYWPPWISIWHVDPEVGGSDDSCGWSYVRLTESDAAWAEKQAPVLWKDCFGYGNIGLDAASTTELLYSVWCVVRTQWTRKRKGYIWKPLPRRDRELITQLCVSSCDNLHATVTHARADAKGMLSLLLAVIRLQRTLYRPWYRHPRWHVQHWRVVVEPVRDLKRFLFSRCVGCGKGFKWGYGVCSNSWDTKGPQWFKGEPHVYHASCMPALVPPARPASSPMSESELNA